jgi:hypothetical protein
VHTRMHWCHFTKLYENTINWDYLFLKHYCNNSIYKITTPSYGVKEEICRRMPRNFFPLSQFQRKRKSLVFFQSINFLWPMVIQSLQWLWSSRVCSGFGLPAPAAAMVYETRHTSGTNNSPKALQMLLRGYSIEAEVTKLSYWGG